MKNLKDLGQALSKAEQKEVFGGKDKLINPCPCSSNYITDPDGSCSYPSGITPWGAPFPDSMCLGTVQNGQCCVN